MKKWKLFSVLVLFIIGFLLILQANGEENYIESPQLNVGMYQCDERYMYLKLIRDKIIIMDTQPILHKVSTLGEGDALLLREPYLFVINDNWSLTKINIYDISNKSDPKIVRRIEVPGNLLECVSDEDELCVFTCVNTEDKKIDNSIIYKDTLNNFVGQRVEVPPNQDNIGVITKIDVDNSSALEVKSIGDGWEDYTFEKDYVLLTDCTYDEWIISKYSIFDSPIQYKGTARFYHDDDSECFINAVDNQIAVGFALENDNTTNYSLYMLDEKLKQLGKFNISEEGNDCREIKFIGNRAYLGNIEETTTCINLSGFSQIKKTNQVTIQSHLQNLHQISNKLGIQLDYQMGQVNEYYYGPERLVITLWDTSSKESKKLDQLTMKAWTSGIYEPQIVAVNKKYRLLAVPISVEQMLPDESVSNIENKCLVLKVQDNKLQQVGQFPEIKTSLGLSYTSDTSYVICIGNSLYYKYNNEISEYDLETLKYKGNIILDNE